MPKISPPPPTNQDVSSRAYRDWFYSIYAALGTPGATLGTMAYENANSVAITGGSIGGVGITGSDVNSTPIGDHNPSTGAFTNLSSNGTVSGTGFTNLFASPPPIGSTTPNTGNFTVMTTPDAVITGGSIDNTSIGSTTPSTGKFTNLYLSGATSGITFNDGTKQTTAYIVGSIEAYDLSSSISLTSTPTLLTPASQINANNVTYSASTGVFTFQYAGGFSLSLVVNATASAANQSVYIYAQSNTGSGWTNIANSGKSYLLPNGQLTQIVYSGAVVRTAGQQIRYYIYSNDSKVTLQTSTLSAAGTPTVYVPAIRIQYSG